MASSLSNHHAYCNQADNNAKYQAANYLHHYARQGIGSVAFHHRTIQVK
jgi:hypothetical protein